MDRARRPRIPTPVILLGLAALLNDVSSDIIYPLLPIFLSAQLGATPFVVGMIEGLADALASILKLGAGWWSDRTPRRKPFVVAGYGIAAVARLILAIATFWPVVLASRLLDRTGKGIRSAPRDALIADVTPPEQRGQAFGLHRAMDHAGALIGPLIAALLVGVFALPFRTIFLIAVIPGIIGVAVIAATLREVPRRQRDAAELATPPAKLPRELRKPLVAIAIFAMANSSDVFLILQASAAGVSTVWIPILWAGHHAVKAALSTAGGALSDRSRRNRVLASGWAMYGVVYFMFPLATSVTWFAVMFVAYALPFTLTEGTERAWIADHLTADLKGRAFGAYYLIQGVCTLAGTAVFGLWYEHISHMGAFHLAGGIALVAAIFALSADRPATPPSPANA
ncbi:MAG: MFS transporter [Thermoanaerobaculia bacterium]|jgi:MFS family permease